MSEARVKKPIEEKRNSFLESIKEDLKKLPQTKPSSSNPSVPSNHPNNKVHIGRSH